MIFYILFIVACSFQLLVGGNNNICENQRPLLSDTLIELLARRQLEIDQMLEENLREPAQDIDIELSIEEQTLQYQLKRYKTYQSAPIEIMRRSHRNI